MPAIIGLSCGLRAWLGDSPSRPAMRASWNFASTLRCRDNGIHSRRDYPTKIYKRHGIRNIAYWFEASGANADRTFVYIRGYPSRQAVTSALRPRTPIQNLTSS